MLPLTALVLVLLAGCGPGDHGSAASSGGPPTTASTSTSTAPEAAPLQVVATLQVDIAVTGVVTPRWLWVLGGPSGVISQVDPETNAIVREVTPPHPAGYGTFAQGSLWVVSFMEDALMQIDADTGRVVRTIESSRDVPLHGPVGVAATGSDLWVVNHDSSTVLRIDSRTASVIDQISLPGRKPGGPLLAGGKLWISLTRDGLVVAVDPATGRVQRPIRVGTGTCAGGSVADGRLWFTSIEVQGFACHDGVSRVDPGTGEVTDLPTLARHDLLSFASAAGRLWASDLHHSVYEVDADGAKLSPGLTLEGPDDSNNLVTAFGSLWVLRQESGRVLRVDAS